MIKILFVIFVSVFAATSAVSAQKLISSQTHGWIMYFGNHKINDRWGLHTEYQWRRAGRDENANVFQDWQQSLLRLGVDYYAKNQTQWTAGYGWIKTFEYGEQPVSHVFNEHRIWEQFIVKNKVGRFDLQHRYRLEQRFVEQYELGSTGEYAQNGFAFRNRVRYRLMVNVPLSRKEMNDNTLFLSMYDEVFLGFGPGIGKNILDQNRLYGALGWRFNKELNVQLGYLNQYVVKTDGIKAERNHTLQLSVTYNFNFSKPKQ
jgi:hypothetical protein